MAAIVKPKKLEFELAIKSKDGSVVLAFMPATKKWEARDKDNKVLGRRRNIAVLIDSLNGVSGEDQ